MSNSNQRGGFRVGSGRKKGESSTVVRVPNGILSEVRSLIDSYKSSSAPAKPSKTLSEPSKSYKSSSAPAKPSKTLSEPSDSITAELKNVSIDVLFGSFGGSRPDTKKTLSKNAKKRQRKKKR